MRYASPSPNRLAVIQMTGKIFLSYLREDTAGFATALFLRLEQSFPPETLFMDVAGGIGAGQNFAGPPPGTSDQPAPAAEQSSAG